MYEYVWMYYEYDYTKETGKSLSRYIHVKHVYSRKLNTMNWNNLQKNYLIGKLVFREQTLKILIF